MLLEQAIRTAANYDSTASSEEKHNVKQHVSEIIESVQPENLKYAAAKQSAKLLPKMFEVTAKQIYHQKNSEAAYVESANLARKFAEISTAEFTPETAFTEFGYAVPGFQLAMRNELTEHQARTERQHALKHQQDLVKAMQGSHQNTAGTGNRNSSGSYRPVRWGSPSSTAPTRSPSPPRSNGRREVVASGTDRSAAACKQAASACTPSAMSRAE